MNLAPVVSCRQKSHDGLTHECALLVVKSPHDLSLMALSALLFVGSTPSVVRKVN